MKRKQRTPRTELLGAIFLNIGCVVLLMNGASSGQDDMIVMMMMVITGISICKTASAVWQFKKLTGHWPDLKYDGLIKPKGD